VIVVSSVVLGFKVVATIEELADVSASSSFNDKLATWVVWGVVSTIKDKVIKKKEMALQEEDVKEVDLETVPVEERLGPGGLDPVEVFKTLPLKMQEAFESRDVEQLKKALMEMDTSDAEYHMKRCVDSGLWNEG